MFVSADPKGQFFSPYRYGPGDPLNYVDPTGMEADDDDSKEKKEESGSRSGAAGAGGGRHVDEIVRVTASRGDDSGRGDRTGKPGDLEFGGVPSMQMAQAIPFAREIFKWGTYAVTALIGKLIGDAAVSKMKEEEDSANPSSEETEEAQPREGGDDDRASGRQRESELDRRVRQIREEKGRISDLRQQLGSTNKGDRGTRRSLRERLKEAQDRLKGHAKALKQKFGVDFGQIP
jgi:hypothetical protein